MQPPTFLDVLAARRRIAPHLARTPLHRYPALDAALGCEAWVKHENHQPVGVFKVRGALNLVAALDPAIRVIGVQAAASPAVHDSWRTGRVQSRPNETFAEGLATGRAAELTLEILRARLDDFQLASDDEIRRGMVAWIERCHTLAESAAGAMLAVADRLRDTLRGRRVGLVLSGGNTSLDHLARALAASSGGDTAAR